MFITGKCTAIWNTYYIVGAPDEIYPKPTYTYIFSSIERKR